MSPTQFKSSQLPSTGRKLPVLAVSAKWFSFPDHFHWLSTQGFALEYTPDGQQLFKVEQHLRPFLDQGIKVRHHGFFPGFEIGDSNGKLAEDALKLHFEAVKAISGIGEPEMTVHIGLKRDIEIDPNRACDNLGRLVNYAKDHDVTISLENLKRGYTSNPKTVRKLADDSGAMITLDIGHAVSCEMVTKEEINVLDFIDLFESRLIEVHLYERETDRHYAPENMDILGPIIDRLIQTKCSWWTIELDAQQDILQTRKLIYEYLQVNQSQELMN